MYDVSRELISRNLFALPDKMLEYLFFTHYSTVGPPVAAPLLRQEVTITVRCWNPWSDYYTDSISYRYHIHKGVVLRNGEINYPSTTPFVIGLYTPNGSYLCILTDSGHQYQAYDRLTPSVKSYYPLTVYEI
jgi:hypothetical protein